MVISKDIPNNIEKIKKIAIFFSLKSANALRPNASAKDLAFSVQVGQTNKIKQYKPKITPKIPKKYHYI